MRTNEQQTAAPDSNQVALMARLADICKGNPAMFAEMVRPDDRLGADAASSS